MVCAVYVPSPLVSLTLIPPLSSGHMDVPGLAMSRSLGDAVAHTAGVSSEPEFVEYEFSQGREDLILVMASDGLWEFMSDQEVCTYITPIS
ncbi:hypothetical protein EON63_21725, partial [archaeon]